MDIRKVCDSELENTIDSKSVEEIKELMLRALAEELQAWYQYWIAIPFLKGILREEVSETFDRIAKDELDDHATKLRERLDQYGVDFSKLASPEGWKDVAKAKFVKPGFVTLESFLKINIEAEKEAIKTYRDLCKASENVDYTTFTLAEEILADEEEHLKELEDYLQDLV